MATSGKSTAREIELLSTTWVAAREMLVSAPAAAADGVLTKATPGAHVAGMRG